MAAWETDDTVDAREMIQGVIEQHEVHLLSTTFVLIVHGEELVEFRGDRVEIATVLVDLGVDGLLVVRRGVQEVAHHDRVGQHFILYIGEAAFHQRFHLSGHKGLVFFLN